MKTKIILSVAALFALGLMSFSIMEPTGIAGYTGSPADGGSNCTDCHSDNPVNTGGGSVTITSVPVLDATHGYMLSEPYVISVTVTKAGQVAFGLDFEALNTLNTANGGHLDAGIDGETQPMSSGVDNIVHSNPANGAGTHTFTFKWTAPSTNIGQVHFYVSGNATDGAGTGGDYVYTATQTVDFATGVSEKTSLDLNLSVFPNPVTETATVSYVLNENSIVSAKLISIHGQTVSTFFTNEQQTVGQQNKKLAIDPSLARGNYFVVINTNGKNSYKKIVVE